jgi:photosystem II stability/assembly factor-like uncharacterized protein
MRMRFPLTTDVKDTILYTLFFLLLFTFACGKLEIGLERQPTPDFVAATTTRPPAETARLGTATSRPKATSPLVIVPTRTPTITPTPATSTIPGPAAYPTPTPLPPPTPVPAPSPTVSTPEEPATVSSPNSEGVTLVSPLLIDSQAGRLYASGQVAEKPKTFVLGAADGHVLATYDIAGPLGLDSVHSRLYIDQDDQGLTVLNAQTGVLDVSVPLPGKQDPWRQENPAPQADPVDDRVLAFRDNVVYVVDPEKGEVADAIPFDISKDDDCRLLDRPLSIERGLYDPDRRILYLDFLTYVCTPWFGHIIVSYDLDSRSEIARQGVLPFQAITFDGYLYGTSWHRFGIGDHWAWRDGQPWMGSTDWSGRSPGFQVDPVRNRLYEAVDGNLRVFDAQTMTLLMSVPQPADGQLAGYDPKTDQLYFLSNGRLQPWPAGAIQAPVAEPLLPSQPPAKPVSALIVSPTWRQDKTLFGIWGDESLTDECYVFGQTGGLLRVSSDGGSTWARPRGGLRGACEYMSAIAVSPAYALDQTLLAGIVGMGIFKSTDGGQLWQPSSAGLSSMGVEQILISPGFAHEPLVFARTRTGGLNRSTDGGRTWGALDVDLYPVAMSPEFDQDRTLMGAAYADSEGRTELRISHDGGDNWERLGDTPEGVTFDLLSLAPLFDKWHVVFGFGSNGALYRSEDGGATWQAVLRTEAVSSAQSQMVYAPDIEVNRPVFLLVTTTDSADLVSVRGTLYRSGDGGLSWKIAQLPEGISPTALAISPNFVQDGLLFIGTGDGRVLTLEAAKLAGQTR